MIFCGPVLEHSKNTTFLVKRKIFMLVRTSCDGLMKPTYVLLKKERTNILRFIVRTFLMKLAPEDSATVFSSILRKCEVRAQVFEPPHDKTNKMTVRPVKTRISLGIRIYNPWPQTSFLLISDYLENPVLEVLFKFSTSQNTANIYGSGAVKITSQCCT